MGWANSALGDPQTNVLTISSGIAAGNKVYDGTTSATLTSNNVVLTGVVNGDAVSLVTNGYTATFASSNAGTNIPVAVIGLTLSGNNAGNYSLSQPALSANILQASTANAVASSSNPAQPDADVTFTATLSAILPGAGTPTGGVTFRDGTNLLDTVALDESGMAALTTNLTTHGNHVITAEYAGDVNFLGSTNTLNPDQLINTPPFAGATWLQTTVNSGASLTTAQLLQNDSDADGDAFTVIAVAGTSAQGGTVTFTNSTITYTPPNNYAGADTFTYTLSDSFNGITTGTVNVAIISLVSYPSVISSIAPQPDGNLEIIAMGLPGHMYYIQAATNLQDRSSWFTIGAVAASSNGVISCVDLMSTNYPARFYRIATGGSCNAYAGAGAIAPTTTGYVTSGNVLAFETNQAWTITAAIKSSVLPMPIEASVIVCKIDNIPTYRGYELWVNNDGNLVAQCISDYSITNRIAVIGSTMVVDGNWHYVAATYDGSSAAAGLKLYVDGVAEATTVWVDNLTGTIVGTAPLAVGAQLTWPYGEFFKGMLDEVTISDIARTPSYLAAHSTSATLPPVDADVQLYYNFDEGSGLSAADSSGYGRTGTLTGNIWTPWCAGQ